MVEEEPSGKHDPCFELNGEKVFKARLLNQLAKEIKNPGSRDRVKRVANISRYAIRKDFPSDMIGYDVPSIKLDMPVVSLLRCEDHIFVCIGEVNDIIRDSKHLAELSLETLSDPLVTISYQLLFLILTTVDDDPTKKLDWRWSLRHGEGYCVAGQLIEAINPAISARDGEAFYLFESESLLAMGTLIFERISMDSARSLPTVMKSNGFPYREGSGWY